MSEPRKQHYVPQAYLRNFSIGNETYSPIYVMSVSQGKIYPSKIKNTAAERDFYTLNNNKDKYVWENFYAQYIEPDFSILLENIRKRCENILVQDHSVVVNEREKLILALNIFFQFFRDNQTRKFCNSVYDEVIPLVAEEFKTKILESNYSYEDFINHFLLDNERFKEVLMQLTFDKKRIYMYLSHIFQRNFLFYKIIGDSFFVTSDHPTMIMNIITGDATPFKNGLASMHTTICFPLSPKLLLVAYHPNYANTILDNHDCRLEFLLESEKKEIIKTINQKQKEQCYNYVYSNSKETLEQIN